MFDVMENRQKNFYRPKVLEYLTCAYARVKFMTGSWTRVRNFWRFFRQSQTIINLTKNNSILTQFTISKI